MKEKRGIAMKTKRILISILVWLILLTVTPPWAFSQDQPAKFRQEELDQMLAPIALYPDSLLAQILMASTYPIEVVQADRWVKANRNLGGDPLNDALDKKDWDPSVKALVPFPQVLSMMSEKLEWTQRLGDAFLDQQDEVMDTVQQLRAKAQAAGNLRDTDEQRVMLEDGAIMIEPAQPEVIYVPAYDPSLVYGPWWYPAFPPFFFFPPPRVVVFGRIGFWTGVRVGRAWDHGWGYWDWRHRHVNVNIDRRININRNFSISRTSIQTTPWQLDVRHRKGVPYRNEATRERHGQSLRGAETRREFRGFGQGTGLPQASGVARQSLPVTKSQQTSRVTRQTLPETKTPPPSAVTPKSVPGTKGPQASGVSPQSLPKTKTPPASGTPPKVSGGHIATGGLDPQRLDRSGNRTAFGSTDRGSDVRKESLRGHQSLQGMSSKGAGGVGRGNVSRGR
jgi:hypothetical protein